MNLNDLQHFVAAYDAKSFSRAAGKLDTTQSNVSLRMRDLERSLGVALFERRHRSVAPTAAGDKLYRHAVEILEAFARAERAMRTLPRNRKTRPLRKKRR